MAGVVATIAGRTHQGLIRDSNEDAFVVGDLDSGRTCGPDGSVDCSGQRGPLLVVCDGIGGARAGDVASQLAAETVWLEVHNSPATDERDVFARHLRRSVRAANRRIVQQGLRVPGQRGMGSTVSAAGLAGDVLVIAQVGDSRAYVLRAGVLTQVTRDQSVVAALVSAARMTESQAGRSLQRGRILQALGMAGDVEVALSIVELRAKDRLLMSSDGLHEVVPPDRLASALGVGEDMAAIADSLVELALEAGAPDNITAVVAEFGGEQLRPADGDSDAVVFTELDPLEEGDQALTTTSVVGRRLAARAGLRKTRQRAIPATGQHSIVTVDIGGDDVDGLVGPGPAERALARGSRSRPIWWVVGGIGVAVLLVIVIGWVL